MQSIDSSGVTKALREADLPVIPNWNGSVSIVIEGDYAPRECYFDEEQEVWVDSDPLASPVLAHFFCIAADDDGFLTGYMRISDETSGLRSEAGEIRVSHIDAHRVFELHDTEIGEAIDTRSLGSGEFDNWLAERLRS